MLTTFCAIILNTLLVALVGVSAAESASASNSPFVIVSHAFRSMLGARPNLTVVVNQSLPLFHEGCIYHPPTYSLFAVSDYFNNPSVNNNQSGQYIIHVTNLSSSTPKYTILDHLPLANPISGTRYIYGGADKLVLAVTGNKQVDSGGLFFLDPYPPFAVTPATTKYGDYPFDGPHDAVAMPDGSIYFTDLGYGWLHGRRPQPLLPNMVYRYDPRSNTTRAMVDLISRPHGITRWHAESVVYVGDTGVGVGNGTIDYTAQRAIYAHREKNAPSGTGARAEPFLADRRIIALPYVGIADGLKTDTKGNVWGMGTDELHV